MKAWYCVRRQSGYGGCKHRHRSIVTARRCVQRFTPALIVKNWSDTMGSPVRRYRVVRSG